MKKSLNKILIPALALVISAPSFAQAATANAQSTSATAQAEQINQTDPYVMMKQVANHTFSRLKDEQKAIHKNPEMLKVIVEQELMPYVNSTYAALKLLGPNLRGAKRSDVEAFIKAFHNYLVSSYAQVLTQYTDQTVEFGPAPRMDENRRIVTVKVNIIDTPRPNIQLAFKLIKNKKTGKWSAFDMVAEGVSLLSSKQSEWSGEIRQKGILEVANRLQALSEKPIQFETSKS